MGTTPDAVKGWLGIFFLVYPVVRLLANAFGADLPDIGLADGIGDGLAGGSAMVGASLLAKSKPII